MCAQGGMAFANVPSAGRGDRWESGHPRSVASAISTRGRGASWPPVGVAQDFVRASPLPGHHLRSPELRGLER